MSQPKGLVVAIDGPASAGKSTIARQVACRLGYLYVDTGAMYRAVAWKALQMGLTLDEPDQIVKTCQEMEIKLEPAPDGQLRILADGEDVTKEIRQPEIGEFASAASAIAGVRKRLVELQRDLGKAGGVVMEGRDIQTVVFPEAEVKVFLTASAEQRAHRRFSELRERGEQLDLESVKREVRSRDQRDSTRDLAPLQPAADAVILDTTNLTIQQVVERVLEIVKSTADPSGSDSNVLKGKQSPQ